MKLVSSLFILFVVSTPTFGSDVTVEQHGPSYLVRGSFLVHTKPAIAWSVLTDYQHMSKFVDIVKQSRISKVIPTKFGRAIEIVQVVETRQFFVSERTTLRLLVFQANKFSVLLFGELSHKDFKRYDGYWQVFEYPQGKVEVSCSLWITPKGHIPKALNRIIIRKVTTHLLDQLQLEIERRTKQ